MRWFLTSSRRSCTDRLPKPSSQVQAVCAWSGAREHDADETSGYDHRKKMKARRKKIQRGMKVSVKMSGLNRRQSRDEWAVREAAREEEDNGNACVRHRNMREDESKAEQAEDHGHDGAISSEALAWSTSMLRIQWLAWQQRVRVSRDRWPSYRIASKHSAAASNVPHARAELLYHAGSISNPCPPCLHAAYFFSAPLGLATRVVRTPLAYLIHP